MTIELMRTESLRGYNQSEGEVNYGESFVFVFFYCSKSYLFETEMAFFSLTRNFWCASVWLPLWSCCHSLASKWSFCSPLR